MEDHDFNLRNVLERCREKAIKLNGAKVQFRCEEVSYMGHTLTKDGLKPDASKVKAVEEMPPPTDKKGVQRLLGMTNYLQRYAPKLAEVTNPLRELTKKESDFIWEESVHGRALAETKRMLTTVPVLKYFDPTMTPVLQCDASMHGLGVCLMQDGQPVAYASRSLTDTEVNYAQIEKGLLTIVYGMSKKEVPAQDLKYVAFREELTAQDGIIFKGERVVVPRSLRKEFTTKVHVSHLGIQACLRRAREVWYWPNMNKEITEYISKCQTCKTYSQEQQKEPMIPYPVPSRPWQVIGTDLFEFQGRNYFVTTDYYSNFFEVDRLYNTTSKEVICRLKAHLARHGIPDRMVSDNGPQTIRTIRRCLRVSTWYEFA